VCDEYGFYCFKMLWFFFHLVIALCYSWQTMMLQSCIPSLSNWAICEIVNKVLSPIIIVCVMNPSHGHWLLWNTLQFIISTCHELCNELAHQTILDNLLDQNAVTFDVELEKLQICMKWWPSVGVHVKSKV
jgi:hypothetical protein